LTSNLEHHPYNDIDSIPPETRTLIIGTAPPLRFSNPRGRNWELGERDTFDFFYGSRDNGFWLILSEIFDSHDLVLNHLLDDVKYLLKSEGIWFHDIAQTYWRKKPDAADKSLDIVTFSALDHLLARYTKIERLLFTSRDAEIYSRRKLEDSGLIKPYQFNAALIEKTIPRRRPNLALQINGRPQFVFTGTGPSPSRRYALLTEEKIRVWRMLLKGE
jgi:G:T/U-mismatch repair DNA glycosylase